MEDFAQRHCITLVMLHGNPTWSCLYRDMIADLSSDFRCVAPDYPGMGLSSARRGYAFGPEEHARIIAGLVQHLDLTDLGCQAFAANLLDVELPARHKEGQEQRLELVCFLERLTGGG